MDSVRSLTQAYYQAPWRKQLKFIGLFLLVVVFAALVAGVYLDVTARAATLGREIQFMQEDIESLELEIADLETQLAQITSATVMEERARTLGFEPVVMDTAEYIVVPGYIPRTETNLAPPPQPIRNTVPSLPNSFSESLMDWVQEQMLPAVNSALELKP